MTMPIYPNMPDRPGAAETRPPAAKASGISSDFQTFLRMLTAQMQNQNPLEPIAASDFAVQLATFSAVEQQVRTNDLLVNLTDRLGLSELANWVGRDALTPAPKFLDGTPLKLVPPKIEGAERAELVLRDLSGAEVARYGVDPNAPEIIFEPPHQSMGGPKTGYYSIEMDGFREGAKIGTKPVLAYSRILEARSDAGQVMLVVEGGHVVNSAAVVGLRD
jgi:flagellar basal-body rod modification protein FlgD